MPRGKNATMGGNTREILKVAKKCGVKLAEPKIQPPGLMLERKLEVFLHGDSMMPLNLF